MDLSFLTKADAWQGCGAKVWQAVPLEEEGGAPFLLPAQVGRHKASWRICVTTKTSSEVPQQPSFVLCSCLGTSQEEAQEDACRSQVLAKWC